MNNKYGAVDKTGKIVVPIKYDCVKLFEHNYWAVSLKNKWGVYNDSSTLVYPIEYRRVDVTEDNGIYLTDDSNHCKRYSFTGELLDNFVIYSVSEMVYNTYVEDKEGLTIYETATCMKYKVPCGKYGLMTKDGHPITDPLFYDIEAIKKDLYLCSYEDEYPNDGESVLMNSKGEIVCR